MNGGGARVIFFTHSGIHRERESGGETIRISLKVSLASIVIFICKCIGHTRRKNIAYGKAAKQGEAADKSNFPLSSL
jgi:hypothetical protein